MEYDALRSELHAIADENETASGNGGKAPSIGSGEELAKALAVFRRDFLDLRPPKSLPVPPAAGLESVLYARILLSCLVDADYTASAMNDDSAYPGSCGGRPL